MHYVQLTLVCFSSVGREPTAATERSVQLDLESETICQRTPESQTCHATVSDSRWIRFYLGRGTSYAASYLFIYLFFTYSQQYTRLPTSL